MEAHKINLLNREVGSLLVFDFFNGLCYYQRQFIAGLFIHRSSLNQVFGYPWFKDLDEFW
jgi:hypothetical protein